MDICVRSKVHLRGPGALVVLRKVRECDEERIGGISAVTIWLHEELTVLSLLFSFLAL